MSPFRTEVPVWRILRCGPEPVADPPRRDAPIDILVSDALTRYWIVERPAGLASLAELDLHAADRFREIFDDEAEQWVIRVDPQPGASRWLASAIPVLFAQELSQVAAGRGWRVRRVQPRFVREYNAHCGRLAPDAVFCVASRESTTIGLLASGEWHGIRVHPPLDCSTASFRTLLRRDARQAGVPIESLEPVIVGSLCEAAQ